MCYLDECYKDVEIIWNIISIAYNFKIHLSLSLTHYVSNIGTS